MHTLRNLCPFCGALPLPESPTNVWQCGTAVITDQSGTHYTTGTMCNVVSGRVDCIRPIHSVLHRDNQSCINCRS